MQWSHFYTIELCGGASYKDDTINVTGPSITSVPPRNKGPNCKLLRCQPPDGLGLVLVKLSFGKPSVHAPFTLQQQCSRYSSFCCKHCFSFSRAHPLLCARATMARLSPTFPSTRVVAPCSTAKQAVVPEYVPSKPHTAWFNNSAPTSRHASMYASCGLLRSWGWLAIRCTQSPNHATNKVRKPNQACRVSKFIIYANQQTSMQVTHTSI